MRAGGRPSRSWRSFRDMATSLGRSRLRGQRGAGPPDHRVPRPAPAVARPVAPVPALRLNRAANAARQLAKSWVSQTRPLSSRITSIPTIVKPLLRMFFRWPSFGGFSLYIDIVMPLAAARIAAWLLALGPE